MASPLDRVRHAAGAIMTDGGSQSGWTVLGDTLQCGHCGYHWMPAPGSGHARGWCRNCSAWLCGTPRCMASCVPEEQMLEQMEAKGRLDALTATDDAERVAGLLVAPSDAAFGAMVAGLYAQLQSGIEYRARLDANLKAIKGA